MGTDISQKHTAACLFVQGFTAQSHRLYEIAIKLADIGLQDIVFDLFCGIGTLSLLAACQADRVAGIEYVTDAVDNARENARINGIDNASFYAGDAAVMFSKAVNDIGSPDVIIVDPPRKGCDGLLIDKMTAAAPRSIVYVSCNPATLARDVAQICSAGYAVAEVAGVDMFPHTTHVETVVLMSRVGE
jgi:23S rRNA (uracil1939-C5)-methyltransferase